MKIDWRRKLASRKFWMALGGFVSAVLLAFGVEKLTVEQVTAIISALALLMSYVLGESYVDANRPESEKRPENPSESEENNQHGSNEPT